MAGPHDRLFRRSFADPEALTWLLRAALPSLNLTDPPALLPTTTVAKGIERIPDLLCDLHPWPLRVAIQHQRRAEPDLALRVAHDTAVLAAAMHRSGVHRHLLTLVVFQGPGAWRPALRIPSLTEALPPDIAASCANHAYRLLHLGHIRDATLAAAPPHAALTARLLREMAHLLDRQPGTDPWTLYLRHVDIIAALRHRGGLAAIEHFLGYIYDIAHQPPGALIMAHLTEHHPDLAGDTLTYSERLLEQGQRGLLTRILQKRLGPPPPEATQWLAQAELPQLEAVADRIFQIESWDDLTRA